ncbi:MAG: S1 RNA-binding domain-containing protein [Firmicutes bacterium]|nr:S1 RNA-binding domain-containing protein [Bacillota bacterium]
MAKNDIVGTRIEGHVFELDETGAWIRTGSGTAVWIPLAEIAWFEIEHPAQKLQEGDSLAVTIIGTREDGSLEGSIRQIES